MNGFPECNLIKSSEKTQNNKIDQKSIKAAIVGFASKGPINTPTLIGTHKELTSIFGYAHPNDNNFALLYTASEFLNHGRAVYIYRASDASLCKSASYDIPSSQDLITIYSKNKGPYCFKNNQFFRWKINGILAPHTLVVLATNSITAQELANEMNEQIKPSYGIKFFAHEDYFAVKTTDAKHATLELVSVQDAMYGPWGVTGIGQDMSPAEKIGKIGPYNMSNAKTMQIVVNGSKNSTIDNIVQTINFHDLEGIRPAEDVADYINNVLLPFSPGGWRAFVINGALALRTKHVGRDASIQIKSNNIFGLDQIIAYGNSPDGIICKTNKEDTCFTVVADSPGIQGNATKVTIETKGETFSITVYNEGVQVELWEDLSKDVSSKFYVESFVNLVSDWIRVIDNPNNQNLPKTGSYLLGDHKNAKSTRGVDGIPEKQDELLMSAIKSLNIDFDFLAVPGRTSDKVIKTVLEVCKRKNCLAIIDAPMELNAEAVNIWAKTFNGPGAIFWPWVQIRDSHSRLNVWVPPSGPVMSFLADKLTKNTIRNVLPGIIGLFHKEKLSSSKVNAIATFATNDSFTLHMTNTLTGENISVRYLLNEICKRINETCTQLNEKNSKQLYKACDYILDQFKINNSITSYWIEIELDTNEEFRAKVGVQPRDSIRECCLDFHFTEMARFR